MAPLQACAGWAETTSCHAHPRILLPQNRCLPDPLVAPFPHQPEPRCNTLDFASKVVCQRGAASRLSARSGASKCAAFCVRHWRPAPLWKPKRNAHQLHCSSSASALIRLPMALTRGTTSAFPIVKSRSRSGIPAVQSSGKPLSRSHSMGVSVRRRMEQDHCHPQHHFPRL